jgi:ABC-2 type transport system permease protein
VSFVRQYLYMLKLEVLTARQGLVAVAVVQIALTVGLVVGFGYFFPEVSKTQALFLTTGTATNAMVTVALVFLPQILSQAKTEGRLDYMLTLPVIREAYLLAQVSFVMMTSIPGAAFALFLGWLVYDISIDLNPVLLLVIPLIVLSLAGVGVAVAIFSPYFQLTNAITQMVIFYVILFAPVMMPKEQLPSLLQQIAVVMPPTYAADAMRGAVTDLPGTHLWRSLGVMGLFTVVSLGASALAVRRRG